ncbi:MAG: T9SS type A sorting domain-containing protein [bacterium]
MQKINKILVITIITLLITINIKSEVRYVSKTAGSIAPYTTWETACDSLQKCFNYCQSGDTVYVNRGIYREVIYVYGKDLTIIGVDTDECIIDGTGIEGIHSRYGMCWFQMGNTTIKNLTLKYKRVDDSDNYTAAVFQDLFTVVSNCIIDSTARGFAFLDKTHLSNSIIRNVDVAIDIGGFLDPEFEFNNNYFYILSNKSYEGAINNGAGGGNFKIYNNIFLKNIEEVDQYAISISTNGRVDIKNNLFWKFKRAIEEWSYPDGVRDTTFIINNTMVNCYILEVLTGNMPKERIIKNNIMAYGKLGICSYNGHPVTSDYNMYYKLWKSPYYQVTPGEHDIIADPMFNNDTIATLAGGYDYRLQKYSPAIDAGDPSILDVDGTRSDMGMYGGPLGTKYAYEDLAPKRIDYITAEYQPDTNRIKLLWEKRDESDFKEYRLYKDINPNFVIDSTKLTAKLTDTLYYDNLPKGTQKLYYKITAIDNTGNESRPSAEINVTITDNDDAVITQNYNYELYQNYPNPFNPSTTISYSLKEPGEVRIKLYSVTGQLIKTIIEGTKNKGFNETKIDFSNYSSGIYLYRLEVTGEGKIPVFNDLKKMTFIK